MKLLHRLKRAINARKSSTSVGERVYDLTWSIPQDFGGLTKVMLRRSRNFVALLGSRVDILTLDYRLDVDSAREKLRVSGELIDGMSLRNAWDEIAKLDHAELGSLGAEVRDGKLPPPHEAGPVVSTNRYIEYFNAEKTIDRVDHLRPDGTPFVIDDRSGGSRRLVLVDPEGRYVSEFSKARDFYFAWLDLAIESHDAVLINESKYIANFLFRYKREGVRVGQVLHNSHLVSDAPTVNGPFTGSRLAILNHWLEFDFLIFLTSKQKEDFVQAFGDSPRLQVIPNSTMVNATQAPAGSAHDEEARSRNKGAVVARLTGQKRVDQAIAGVGRADTEVTLAIFGDGNLRQDLERMVSADTLLDRRVTFMGHVDGAGELLGEYSFILLTSAFEGMGVVLIEAMSRGCIPIAYDIRYGPSDIIDDGSNGFLVKDPTELASAIEKIQTMEGKALSDLRRAAMEKSRSFSDENITARWSQLFAELTRSGKGSHGRRTASPSAQATVSETGDVLFQLHHTRVLPGEKLTLIAVSRDGKYSYALPVGRSLQAVLSHDELGSLPRDCVLDLWSQSVSGNRIDRRRVRWSRDSGPSGVKIGWVHPYRTVHGNFSIKLSGAAAA